jgi:hypothetical protein
MPITLIYTVITGNYDTIKQPLVVEEGVEYVLYTNNREIRDTGVWRVVQIPSEQWQGRAERENNILLSRKVKMLPHVYLPEECELSIYVDADMLIKGPLTELLKHLREETLFAACRHSYCGSVREEIEDLVAKGMVDATQIENQWQHYIEWGFKDDLGISENGLLIRRHNDARVAQLMELWWEEYQNGCLRDQVSLMPCIYRTNFMPYFQFIEMDIRNNNFMEVMRHKVDK